MSRKLLSSDCETLLNGCRSDFKDIDQIIKIIGKASNGTPFLTRYALIKSYGTIERCYKNIIADFCEPGSSRQMKTFFDKNFRTKPAKLEYDKIIFSLKFFDKTWKSSFVKEMGKFTKNKEKIRSSVGSLVAARHEFAHGGNPTITYRDIKNYFRDAEKMIRCLNRIIK